MKKTVGFFMTVVMCCVGIGPILAQSNEAIDLLLDEPQATMGSAAYLVLVAADIARDDWTREQSVRELASFGWGFEDARPEDPVNLGSLAYMIMRSFDMKGGIMYAIFPGRRYAAREFAFRKIVPGISSSYRILSGLDVANILGKALDFMGQRELEGGAQ